MISLLSHQIKANQRITPTTHTQPADSYGRLGIHEIAFEVQDLERSIAFYRDILGLPLYSRGPQQAWFCIGTQRLALFTHDRPGSGQHFALLIRPEKAEQARDALIAHGFPEQTMQQDDGFSVYVRDPDGNKIELYGKWLEGLARA